MSDRKSLEAEIDWWRQRCNDLIKLLADQKSLMTPNILAEKESYELGRLHGAAAEREACATVCDDEALRCEAAVQMAEPDEVSAILSTEWKISLCAAAIRARSKT